MLVLSLLSRLFPRADHVLWLSMWRRIAALWALFGAEVALIGITTWTKRWADAALLDLQSEPPGDDDNADATSVEQTELAEQVAVQAPPQVWGTHGRSAVAPLPADSSADDGKKMPQTFIAQL